MTGKRARRAETAHGGGPGLAAEHGQSAAAPPERAEAKRSVPGRRSGKRPQPGPGEPRPSQITPAQAVPPQEATSPTTQSQAAEDALAAMFALPEDAVVRRTKDGWRVGSDELPDLTCAMILADLLAAETGMPDARPGKPSDESAGTGETGKLRATVGQLEHALLTRIRVEQAIGVLAERHRIKPRQAFEQLRDAARSRGRKVIDIAGDVVASATNPLLQLPDELSRPRSGPRRARQSFNAP
jgi:ANTAR domain-containing protein